MENKILYKNVDKILLKFVPEFREVFDERKDITEKGKLKYMVFVAFYEFLEKTNLKNSDLKNRIRDFISCMHNSPDNDVQDLLIDFFDFISDKPDYFALLSEQVLEVYLKRIGHQK